MYNTAVTVVLFSVLLESLIIIIGNIFTILVFWKNRKRLKRTSFFLINLAVADLLVGFAALISFGAFNIPGHFKKRKLEQCSQCRYFKRFSNRFWFCVSVIPRTYLSGTCKFFFYLAAPPSSSKY